MKSRARTGSGKQGFFDAKRAFKKTTEYGTAETIVAQGEDCSDIHCVESGLVKLALVSKRGKGAVLGILGQGDFFGEACIGGDTVYSTSAIALVPTCISVMPGRAMLRTLKEDSAFAMQFMNYLLTRNRRIEQDLIDHMLHFSEKRLARTLISLTQSRNNGQMASMLEKYRTGHAGGHDWNNPLTGEFLYEQVPEIRTHPLQLRRRIEGLRFARQHITGLDRRSGVPRNATELPFSRLPFAARENARCDFDKTRCQLENRKGGPTFAFPGMKAALIERLRHVCVGKILHNHFGEVVQNLSLGGIFLEV